MTSLQEVRRVVQARLDKFQPAQRSWDAYLGDGNGTINDESQPFHTYVRYPAANSPATSITNTRVPAQIENLRIKVGYLPEQPTLLQVLSVVPDQRLDDAGSLALIPTHAPTHIYGGSDPVYVVWRQIGDFRLYATGGLQVTLQGGIATIAGTVTTISTQLIDLTDSVPATGARWSLISIDSTGAVNVTDGTPQTTATALTLTHIPATPSGEWRIWAIKLQASQTVIDESRLFVDTLDLRWPQNVGAGSVALSDLAAGSAQYQYLTTGASPYTPAWSSGFLNITAAKTLSATGTLTLTPSSDGLTLTVPATGTTALINYANAGYIETAGTFRLPATTGATVGVLNMGGTRFIHDYSGVSNPESNLFIGRDAGNFTLAEGIGYNNASFNVGIGYHALNAVTTGGGNICIGYQAGESATTAIMNVAIAYTALKRNVDSPFNVAIGDSALSNLVTGATGGNVGIGWQSLVQQTGDCQSTAIGYGSAQAITTGLHSTAIGYLGLTANIDGNDNTAIGWRSLSANVHGGLNTVIGSNSARNQTSGDQNTFIGNATGYSNVSGSLNVFIGWAAGYYETGSNKLFIDNDTRASEADARAKALVYGVFGATPSAQSLTTNGTLYVNQNSVATSGTLQSASITHSLSPTGATTGTYSGLSLSMTTNANVSFASANVFGIQASLNHAVNQTLAGVSFMYPNIYNTGGGTLSAGALYDGIFTMSGGGLTVEAYTLLSRKPTNSGGTIYNHYHAYFANAGTSVSNSYGIYAEAITGSNERWFLYSLGGHSYHKGNLLLGTTTDGMTADGSIAIAKDLAHRGTLVGFNNATPIAMYSSTGDLRQALIDFGLYTTGGASPLDLNGGRLTGFVSSLASTTASASIKIPAGTAPTSPVEGDQWNDSTQKADIAFIGGVKQSRVGCIFTQTADVTVASTASETTLIGTGVGTVTLPANFFTVGKTIRIGANGHYSTANPAGTLQIKVKLGTTVILDTTASTMSNGLSNLGWTIAETVITCRTTGATGTVMGQGYTEFSTTHTATTIDDFTPNTTAVTIDTTATQAISITAQWGTSSASNTITATNVTIEVLN